MIFIIPQLKKKHAAPGVYRILFDDKWIYIGSSGNLSNRIRRWHSCINGNIHYKNINMKMILPKSSKVCFEIVGLFNTANEALIKEGELLKDLENYEYLLNRCPDPTTPKGVRPYIGQQIMQKKIHLPRSAFFQPVAKFDEDGLLIGTYESVKATALANNTTPKKIAAAMRESFGRYKGFIYKRINKDGTYREPSYRKRNYKVNRPHKKYPSKKILQINLDGDVIGEYFGLTNAALAVGLKSAASIHAAITGKKRSAAGFNWRYA